MTTIEKGMWYPDMPPALTGETDDQYMDRLTGADLAAEAVAAQRSADRLEDAWRRAIGGAPRESL
jgi:hypothetical protein